MMPRVSESFWIKEIQILSQFTARFLLSKIYARSFWLSAIVKKKFSPVVDVKLYHNIVKVARGLNQLNLNYIFVGSGREKTSWSAWMRVKFWLPYSQTLFVDKMEWTNHWERSAGWGIDHLISTSFQCNSKANLVNLCHIITRYVFAVASITDLQSCHEAEGKTVKGQTQQPIDVN